MRVLAVHPGPLMYTRIFLRLEPLGLELVASAVRQAGHQVALIDLQVETHRDFFGWVERWRPDVVAPPPDQNLVVAVFRRCLCLVQAL